MHLYMLACMHILMLRMHTPTYASLRGYIYIYINIACMHAHLRKHTYTYTYKDVYLCIHTHTYIYIYICINARRNTNEYIAYIICVCARSDICDMTTWRDTTDFCVYVCRFIQTFSCLASLAHTRRFVLPGFHEQQTARL